MRKNVAQYLDTCLRMDLTVFDRNWNDLKSKAATAQVRLDECAGFSVNTHSSKDLSKLFFERFGLRPERLGKSGRPSFAASVLKMFNCPATPLVSELKHLLAVDKAFRSAEPFIDRASGTLTYNVVEESTTGRIYAEDPNVTAWPAELREVVVPKDGCTFLYGDIKANEMCILAHFLGEGKVIEDIHAGIDPFEITRLPDFGRDDYKQAFYAYMYGATFAHIARNQFKTEGQVRAQFEKLFERYPRLINWMDVRNQVDRDSGSKTLGGAEYLFDTDCEDREEEIRRGVNFIVQGTAAEILEDIVKELHSVGGYSIKVLVFDALLVEVPTSEVEARRDQMSQIMAKQLFGKLRVKINRGLNWREAWEK